MRTEIELFSSPGCSRCSKAKQALRTLSKEIGDERIIWREVDVLDDLDYAVSLGVLATPSIVIDGVLTFTGLPSLRKLRAELEQRLVEDGE